MTYPGVGPFSITGMSPIRVATAGGTLVTITGDALPLDPQVRIGATAAAEVVSSTTTRLVFRTPARVAGAYDVHVFARDGRTSVLADALTYTDDPLEPAAGGDQDGSEGPDGSGSGPGDDEGAGATAAAATSPTDVRNPSSAAARTASASSGRRSSPGSDRPSGPWTARRRAPGWPSEAAGLACAGASPRPARAAGRVLAGRAPAAPRRGGLRPLAGRAARPAGRAPSERRDAAARRRGDGPVHRGGHPARRSGDPRGADRHHRQSHPGRRDDGGGRRRRGAPHGGGLALAPRPGAPGAGLGGVGLPGRDASGRARADERAGRVAHAVLPPRTSSGRGGHDGSRPALPQGRAPGSAPAHGRAACGARRRGADTTAPRHHGRRRPRALRPARHPDAGADRRRRCTASPTRRSSTGCWRACRRQRPASRPSDAG